MLTTPITNESLTRYGIETSARDAPIYSGRSWVTLQPDLAGSMTTPTEPLSPEESPSLTASDESESLEQTTPQQSLDSMMTSDEDMTDPEQDLPPILTPVP